MFNSKMNLKIIVATVLTLSAPFAGHASYSSAKKINDFLSNNHCVIKAMNRSDNTKKYQRNLNQEIEDKSSSLFVKKSRIEESNDNQDHIFVPAPSGEVGVSILDQGVNEEFYIYFDLNKNKDISGAASVSDLFIYTDNTFTEVPAKLENFSTNEPFSLKFRTQVNTDRYYFLQCYPNK
ncbi:MAG: hypothetical protein ACXVCP_14020 [Bdellovibrio sp.]